MWIRSNVLFEWDENKRESNLRKHGLDLTSDAKSFDGRPVITYPSSHAGEARFVTVGQLEGEFVAVVWTERRTAIRLISLRKARNAEKRTHRQIFG
jgi:uncharacterized protein